MKILYVDIDGPLATDECSKTLHVTKWHPKLYRFNDKCVVVLNEILNETQCDMIVSSDWRKYFNLEQLGEIFEWNGVVKRPIAVTSLECVSWGNLALNRIHQIKLSLEEHKPESWAIIDDLPLGDKQFIKGLSNYVYCDVIEGIAGLNKKDEVISLLNNK